MMKPFFLFRCENDKFFNHVNLITDNSDHIREGKTEFSTAKATAVYPLYTEYKALFDLT